MDFGGITRKLESPPVGQLLGAFLANSQYGGGSLEGAINSITEQVQRIIQTPHFPNISHVMSDLTVGQASAIFKPAIMGAILGYLLEEIDMNPQLANIGKMLKSLGVNVAIGTLGASIAIHSSVYYSGRGENPSPSYSGSGKGSYGY